MSPSLDATSPVLAEQAHQTIAYPSVTELLRRHYASRGPVPQTEEWRPFFGKSLTPSRIESALLSADQGFLQDLTDIGQEQLCYDPHLASVVCKRIGRLGAAPWDVTPAQGSGVDKKFAQRAADLVRAQFAGIPSFSQAVEDLAWAHWEGRGGVENHWESLGTGWRLAEFGFVHPRRFALGRRRELRLIEGFGKFGFESDGIDVEALWGKFVTLKPRLFNDYAEREGLLRHCIFWSFHKRFAARERAIVLELFGHSRRLLKETEENKTAFDDGVLQEHAERLDGMNTGSTAFLPKGLEFENFDVDSDATVAHERMIEGCNKELSKVVLGGIGTTDEVKGGGLGARTSETHDEQQQFIFERDGVRVAERFQLQAVRPMLVLNRARLGVASVEDVLALAPLFSLRTRKEEDRAAVLGRVKSYLDLGLAMAADEVRQIAGYRKPDRDEAILQLVDSEQVMGSARFVEPRIRVIDPSETEAGQDTATAPKPQGANAAPAPKSPDGAPAVDDAQATDIEAASTPLDMSDDDDWGLYNAPVMGVHAELEALRDVFAAADSEATNFPTLGANMGVSLRNSGVKVYPPAEVAELKTAHPSLWKLGGATLANIAFRRLAPVALRRGVVQTDQEEEMVRLREAFASKHIDDADLAGVVQQMKWLVVGAQGIDRMRRIVNEAKQRAGERQAERAASPLMLAQQTPNGSPETLIARYKRAGFPVLAQWAATFESAAEGATAGAIKASLRKAAKSLDAEAFAKHIEPMMLHAAMLGAQDAAYEAEHDTALEPTKFDARGEPINLAANFVTKVFQEAVDSFLAKEILPKKAFDKLEGAAKRAAFTIATLATKEMLQTSFDALATAIRDGRSLRSFRKDLNARFDSNGWTRLDGAHVENVFRTNVMTAYSDGRQKQMTQPAVLKARPYWQIFGANDSRTRATHAAAHRKVVAANDPAWKKARTPFGFQCFTAETLIQGHILGAARSFYVGKAVEITTLKGRCLTVTANHPVLTAKGFVAAQSLGVGENLVCDSWQSGVSLLGKTPQWDENNEPATAENVFRSMANAGTSSCAQYAPVDFHGEAQRMVGDIEVVGTYRNLLVDAEFSLFEQGCDIVFKASALGGSSVTAVGDGLSMGQRARPGASSPSSGALSNNSFPVELHSAPLQSLRLGASAQHDSSFPECFSKPVARDVDLFSELVERGSGLVELDEIVDVNVFDFSGHVYDFESNTGWVFGNGIVASNCRCRIVSRSEADLKRLGLEVSDGAEVLKDLPDPGFTSSASML